MQQSISFSLIIIPLCQTKLENSSLNVISFSVKSSPARFSPPRPERSFQNVSGKAFTSSVGRSFQAFSGKALTSSIGKIVPNLLWQGFHLLDRESDQSCNSLWSYAFWQKTPYTGYGALVETPDFRQYNKNRRIETWIGRFESCLSMN